MKSQTIGRTAYSTTEPLRREIHNLVNEHSERDGSQIRSLATNIYFDIEEESDVLSDAADELIMVMLSATFRDELRDDQQAVVAHSAELASLVNRCMQGNDIDEDDVNYYSEKIAEERKRVGLMQYEDICE